MIQSADLIIVASFMVWLLRYSDDWTGKTILVSSIKRMA